MSIHPHPPTHARRAATARRTVAGAAMLALAGTATADAQVADPSRRAGFELRPFVGAYLPTGDQRDLLRDGFHLGAQASYRIVPQLAVVGTFAWSASEDRVAPGDRSVDVFHYDLGLEGRAASWLRGVRWDFTPFAGIGLGGRTYDQRDFETQSKIAGYGALGGEFGFGRVGLRVEARDYLSRFTPANRRGDSDTRNDITVVTGLTVRF